MKLSTILAQAKSGELSNIAAKDDEEKIVQYINLGLIALYSKFPLKIDEAIIELQAGKTMYKLDGTEGTLVNVNGLPIVADTVMKIVAAYDEVSEIPLNNESDETSIHTPTYDSIQVPLTADNSYISILFRAMPDDVEYEVVDDVLVDKEVALPKQMLEALLHYIGYRAHGAMNGSVDKENNTHLQRFEASCKKLETFGLIPTDSLEMNNHDRGFNV